MQVKLRIYVSKHLSHSEWLVILTCYFSGVYFMRLTIKGGLQFLFLYFIERYRWRSVFPWLRFVDQTLSHSIFFSITCTSVTGGIMINRRQLYSGAELGGCQGGHCPPKILPGPPKIFRVTSCHCIEVLHRPLASPLVAKLAPPVAPPKWKCLAPPLVVVV